MSNKDEVKLNEQATAKENDNRCEWKDCKTCGAINSLKKSSWCFEWLQHLVDFTDLEHLNDKDRQVHLMGNHRDSEMTKIRSKLGNLQQQTPAWTLLDTLYNDTKSMVWSKTCDNRKNITERSFQNFRGLVNPSHDRQNADLSKIEVETQILPPEIKTAAEFVNVKCTTSQTYAQNETITQNQIEIVRFVQDHVFKILSELYEHIDREESYLRGIGIGKSEANGEQSKPSSPQHERARNWFKLIYANKKVVERPSSAPNEKHDSSSGKQIDKMSEDSRIKVVGPVGERPLHVCALSIHRFGDIAFGGGEDCFKKGVMYGMIKYIEQRSAEERLQAGLVTSRIWEEVQTPYSKDYCAALGAFLVTNGIEDPDSIRLLKSSDPQIRKYGKSLFQAQGLPPYFVEVFRWSAMHLKPTKFVNISSSFSKDLVTVGLYEGETILYPLIAGNDEAIIQWLLGKERKALIPSKDSDQTKINSEPREISTGTTERDQENLPISSSLLELPATGLFFHPMFRRILTSFSSVKGWNYYMRIRFRDVNTEASSRRSYFGLNVLAFAASQGHVHLFDMLFSEVEELLASRKVGIDHLSMQSVKGLADRKSEGEAAGIQSNRSENITEQSCPSGNHEQGGKPWEEEVTLEEKVPTKSHYRKALLDAQDEYGNTMLHLAAWNDKAEMFDRLVELGADMFVTNDDGLTPFTLAARFGIWNIFNHIWNSHMTKIVWKFGNIEKKAMNYSSFDWKGVDLFVAKQEVRKCLEILIKIIQNEAENLAMESKSKGLSSSVRNSPSEFVKAIYYCIIPQAFSAQPAMSVSIQNDQLKVKLKAVRKRVQEHLEQKVHKSAMIAVRKFLFQDEPDDLPDKEVGWRQACFACLARSFRSTGSDEVFAEQRSAVRMITLFRPKDWYANTEGKVEQVILRKWENGFRLVHLGQSIIPYCALLLVFCLMWWFRELHVLQHNFWWADSANIKASGAESAALHNPVVADVAELALALNSSVLGSDPYLLGLLPKQLSGPESACGWRAIQDSYSGRLQAVLTLYGAIAIFRLAFTQRRTRPTDLDENEDQVISMDEFINFIYFNLESLIHLVLCALFVIIGASRVAAGPECSLFYITAEKNATAIAGLFLFLNLMPVFRPYKSIGFLVLTTYQFLMSDIFSFLFMYSVSFAGFFVALQTLHNANHVYLAWMDVTTRIFPQISSITDGMAYLTNNNIPNPNGDSTQQPTQLVETHLAMEGCEGLRRTVYDTAFTLLEISFGDGLADALTQARRSDYQCAGFTPNALTIYILVFWVFLTNVLILNMIVAMMNHTFDRHIEGVESAWLLDVSYRIMRYERLFPELKNQMQTPRVSYSVWKIKFWKQLLMDMCLVLYCLPDVHLWGFSHVVWVFLIKQLRNFRLRPTKDSAAKHGNCTFISEDSDDEQASETRKLCHEVDWIKILGSLKSQVNSEMNKIRAGLALKASQTRCLGSILNKTIKSRGDEKQENPQTNPGGNKKLTRRGSLHAEIQEDREESKEDELGDKLAFVAVNRGVRSEVEQWLNELPLHEPQPEAPGEGSSSQGAANACLGFAHDGTGGGNNAAEAIPNPSESEGLQLALLLVSLIYRLDRLYLGTDYSSVIHDVRTVPPEEPAARARGPKAAAPRRGR